MLGQRKLKHCQWTLHQIRSPIRKAKAPSVTSSVQVPLLLTLEKLKKLRHASSPWQKLYLDKPEEVESCQLLLEKPEDFKSCELSLKKPEEVESWQITLEKLEEVESWKLSLAREVILSPFQKVKYVTCIHHVISIFIFLAFQITVTGTCVDGKTSRGRVMQAFPGET